MAKKVAYWTTTVIVAALSLIAARGYICRVRPRGNFPPKKTLDQFRFILAIPNLLVPIPLVIPAEPEPRKWANPGSTLA